MMYSKLKGNALGASGQPLPDRATQDQFERSLKALSEGYERWTFDRSPGLMVASVVRGVAPVTDHGGEPDLYRLMVSCREDRQEASMQLAWSPGVPDANRSLSVRIDGNSPVLFSVAGKEKMGNGQPVMSGPGAVSWPIHALPRRTLEIGGLFADEQVSFPFTELGAEARHALEGCLTSNRAAK
jgi:hypothetical protein